MLHQDFTDPALFSHQHPCSISMINEGCQQQNQYALDEDRTGGREAQKAVISLSRSGVSTFLERPNSLAQRHE